MSETKDTFVQFGHSFQVKVVTGLIIDGEYLSTVYDILEKRYFDSDALQWLVDAILEYHKHYKTNPTWEALAVIVNDQITSDILKTSVMAVFKEAYEYRSSNDLEFVKDQSTQFCTNQSLARAIDQSITEIKDGNYQEVRKLVDNALKAGVKKDIGHVYKTMLDARMNDAARKAVATPWDVINDITDGGSASGDLFVIVAPPGIGKTWALIAVGAHAIREGKKVIHFTMELQDKYVGRRYDSHFTGISTQNLKYHREDIEIALNNLSDGELIVKYYPPKYASLQTLRSHIEMCKLQGFIPDLVIVDYADLIKPMGGHKEVRHQLENIYEELRAIAGEFGIPVWSASQANRSAMEEDIIGGDKIAEAFSKLMVADFVMSLSRKIQDKIGGTARWHIIKNRFGPDGQTFPSHFNTANGVIKIYEEKTQQGKELSGTMKNGHTLLRKFVGQRRKELEDNNPSLDLSDEDEKLGGFEE